jgi:CHAT domain-containing protein
MSRKAAPKSVAVIADPVFTADDARVVIAKNKARQHGNDPVSSLRDIPDTQNSSFVARIEGDVERSTGEVGINDNGRGGIPRLSFSRREADDIVALSPSSDKLKAVDFEATIATATSQRLAQYRIVHFATHGLLNTQHPELSGVILSLVDEHGAPQDGFLRLNEIYNLNLPADLVVLSACNSALGKEVKGEGLVGLTRGFMYAGASRVVASLWKVDDAATAEFMKIFYRKMFKDGMRPAGALSAAQVEMSAQKRWQSPYYWAAFVLQGDWK